MKSYRWIAVAVVLSAAVVLAGSGLATAEGNVTYVTGGTEVPASDADCAAAGGFRDYVTGDGACVLAYLGLEVSGNGKHFEGARIGYWRDDSPDPRLTGFSTSESHIYLNLETGTSHMWGTWRLVPDGNNWEPGTAWEGTWTAQGLPGGKFFLDAHADGTGSFEGQKLMVRRDITTMMIITTGK